MTKRIVQVRGTTGSGKTTAMRRAIELAGSGVTRLTHGGRQVTVTPKFTVLGDYNNRANCVGADRFRSRSELMGVLRETVTSGVERIAFESMIYSTTYKFAHDASVFASKCGYEFVCVFLDIDYDTALERVLGRNGGKPINYDKLAERILRCKTAYEKMKASGVRCLDVDSATMTPDEVGLIVYREIMR